MAYKKVAVAGATGNLGPFVVQALVDAGFEVTTLSRTGRTDTKGRTGETGQLPTGIRTISVDYASEESVITALTGQEALVCLLPNHDAQPALIDAAIKAGVKRYLPSEFGSNIAGNEKCASLPVFKKGKLATQEYLKTVADKISYTIVVNGFLLDWGLKTGYLINLHGQTRVMDGGDIKHSFTLRSDVGKAVVGILNHPEETKNRAVYVQSIATSQNELLAVGTKAKSGWLPEVQPLTTEGLMKHSLEGLAKGGEAIMQAMAGFIMISAIGTADYGSLWADKNDNALFGIQELTTGELEKLVASV